MPGKQFLDTNILVYTVDRADMSKHKRAQELLTQVSDVVISAQVLNEFYVVLTKKLAVPVGQARAMVDELASLRCVPIDADLVRAAIESGARWQLSHWDALVVEAARHAGCDTVVTEDLAAGARYDGIRIENPFQ
jgi:predicted nucleic acid-binding protein